MNIEHVINIERQLKHLEKDTFKGDITLTAIIDYINQIRSITSQIKEEELTK